MIIQWVNAEIRSLQKFTSNSYIVPNPIYVYNGYISTVGGGYVGFFNIGTITFSHTANVKYAYEVNWTTNSDLVHGYPNGTYFVVPSENMAYLEEHGIVRTLVIGIGITNE